MTTIWNIFSQEIGFVISCNLLKSIFCENKKKKKKNVTNFSFANLLIEVSNNRKMKKKIKMLSVVAVNLPVYLKVFFF